MSGLWLIAVLCLGCELREPPEKEIVLIPIPYEDEGVLIRSGETLYRDFELEPGELIHLVAHQRGIDVAVRLRDLTGEVVVHVDSPNGIYGPEELVEIAETSGTYRFEVVGPEEEAHEGKLVFQVLERRPATAADRELVATDHVGRDAWRNVKGRDAIATLRRALETWQRLEQPAREAETRYRLCRIHQRLNERDLALAYCDQALKIYRALGDRSMTATALIRAGSIRQRLGQVQRALLHFKEALPLIREIRSQADFVRTLGMIGSAHHRLREYRQALGYYDRALTILESSTSSDSVYAGLALSKGTLLLDLNRTEDALEYYRRAEEIYRRFHDETRLPSALYRVANVSLRLGKLEEAEEKLVEAIRILGAHASRSQETARDLAMSYCLLGRTRTRKGQYEASRVVLSKALELNHRAQDRQVEGITLLELGHLRVLLQEPEEGLRHLDQAFKILTEVEDLASQTVARLRGAEALRNLGRLDEAASHITPALLVHEKLRNSSDRVDVRTDYFAFRQEFFELAIDILMDLDAKEPEAGHHVRAFEIHERRRARELLDVLAERPIVSRQQAGADLLDEEHRLEEELRALTRSVDAQDLDARIAQLVGQLSRMRGEIRQAARRAAALVAPTAPAGLGQVREAVLDENTLILVYSLGKERSYLWSISSKTIRAHELPPRRTVEGLARRFADHLRTPSTRGPQAEALVARQLSDMLLGPVSSELERRRLIVVPMGDLQRIPFTALPMPGATLNEDFLIRHHEVVLLPSLSALLALRRNEQSREAPQRAIAAFADPVFRADDPRVRPPAGKTPASYASDPDPDPENGDQERDVHRLSDRLGFDPYERLRYSRAEVEAILGLAPEQDHLLAVDFDASRENFVQSQLGDFRILHFATHAFQDQDHPELAGLVFSLVDENGRDRNGFLRAFEVSRLRLPVELVVLSACQTGRGKDIPGEGVMGLTRAFFDAGAARVISSLWRVSDRSTARLMTSFYQAHLQNELVPSAALRQAQLKMLEDPQTAAPFHWAGFIFQGEWREALRGHSFAPAIDPARPGGQNGRQREEL